MSNIFTPRLERPVKGNKYYITRSAGGYSQAILGKCKSTGKPDPQCNTLANCVGYAYGRFHESINDPTMSYVAPVNAEDFPEYAPKLKQGTTPKLGAIIVWRKGKIANDTDGAGHVAIVEKIYSDGSILVSESGYNSNVYWTAKHEKGTDGNWTKGDDYSWMKSNYKFRCFLYPPIEFDPVITYRDLKKGDTGCDVKELQHNLNLIKHYGLIEDGSFGSATDKSVRDYQSQKHLTVDGVVGPNTRNAIQEDLKNINKPAGVSDLIFLLDNKKVLAWGMMAGGQNYIRMVDLQNLGIVKSVAWNSSKQMVEVKTR